MDEKHDQTVAMLNDETRSPRTRINENQSAMNRVTYSITTIFTLIQSIGFHSVVRNSSVH